jgi:hypothetical protein
MVRPAKITWGICGELAAGVIWLVLTCQIAWAGPPVTLSLPEVAVAPGAQKTMVLSLGASPTGIYSVDLRITYDSAVVSAVSLAKGNLIGDWTMVSNLGTPGLIRVGLAGSRAVTAGGELLSLTLQAVGSAGSTSALTLTQGDLNEGVIASSLDHGLVSIVVPISGLSASNDGPTALGETTHLTATVAIGPSVGYAWDLGDGTLVTGSTISHVYAAVDAYTAIVTATNGVGSATAQTIVTVRDVPISGLQITGGGSFSPNQPVVLTATVQSGSNIEYTWDCGDHTSPLSERVIVHSYSALGAYTVTLNAINPVSQETARTTVTVNEYRSYLPFVVRRK